MKEWILDWKNYIFVYVIGHLLRGVIYHFFPYVNELLTAVTILWPMLLLGDAVFRKSETDPMQRCFLLFVLGAVYAVIVNLFDATGETWLSIWQMMSLFLLFSHAKHEEAERFEKQYDLLAIISAGVIVLLATGSLFLLACFVMRVSLPGGLASAEKLFTYGHMGSANRFCGLFGYSADGGNLCALAVLLLLYLVEKGRLKRWQAAIGTVILLVTICFLDVRTSILELLAAALILTYRWLSKKTGTAKALRILLGGGILLAGAVIFIKRGAIASYLSRIQTDPEMTLKFLTTGRSVYWSHAWKGFLRRPVYGHGWINNTHMYKFFFDNHNLFFNVIYWTGLCGLLPLSALAFFSIRTIRKKKMKWIMRGVIVAAVLVESMLDRAVLGTANTAVETSFFWLSLGSLLYCRDA